MRSWPSWERNTWIECATWLVVGSFDSIYLYSPRTTSEHATQGRYGNRAKKMANQFHFNLLSSLSLLLTLFLHHLALCFGSELETKLASHTHTHTWSLQPGKHWSWSSLPSTNLTRFLLTTLANHLPTCVMVSCLETCEMASSWSDIYFKAMRLQILADAQPISQSVSPRITAELRRVSENKLLGSKTVSAIRLEHQPGIEGWSLKAALSLDDDFIAST